MPEKQFHNEGFTLIELLVVISIIALMASAVLAAFSVARARSRDTKRKSDAAIIRKALELYLQGAGNGLYPNGGTMPAPNTAYDAQLLGTFLVPAQLTAIPSDPLTGPAVYQYAWANNGRDYIIIIPFNNDGGTTCKFTSPGAAAIFGGIPVCNY